MSSPFIARKPQNDFKYPTAPAGWAAAVCRDLHLLEPEDYQNNGKYRQKIRLFFQLGSTYMDDENVERYHTIAAKYTLSLADKANLKEILEGWRGSSFTEEEKDGFDIETVVGAPCFINVVHNREGDKTYANIGAIGPLPPGTEAPVVDPKFVRKKDRDDFEGWPDQSKAFGPPVAPQAAAPAVQSRASFVAPAAGGNDPLVTADPKTRDALPF